MKLIMITDLVEIDTANDQFCGAYLECRQAKFFDCTDWNPHPKVEILAELFSHDGRMLDGDLRVEIGCYDFLGGDIGRAELIVPRGRRGWRPFYVEFELLFFPSRITLAIEMP